MREEWLEQQRHPSHSRRPGQHVDEVPGGTATRGKDETKKRPREHTGGDVLAAARARRGKRATCGDRRGSVAERAARSVLSGTPAAKLSRRQARIGRVGEAGSAASPTTSRLVTRATQPRVMIAVVLFLAPGTRGRERIRRSAVLAV